MTCFPNTNLVLGKQVQEKVEEMRELTSGWLEKFSFKIKVGGMSLSNG